MDILQLLDEGAASTSAQLTEHGVHLQHLQEGVQLLNHRLAALEGSVQRMEAIAVRGVRKGGS